MDYCSAFYHLNKRHLLHFSFIYLVRFSSSSICRFQGVYRRTLTFSWLVILWFISLATSDVWAEYFNGQGHLVVFVTLMLTLYVTFEVTCQLVHIEPACVIGGLSSD